MLILDYQQVAMANLSVFLAMNKNMSVDEHVIRGMILNSIRANRVKFKDYGELVIATDSRNSWRKDVYPYYKANRATDREASVIDWDIMFELFTQIRMELTEYFPYRVINVPRAEADDIIGVLAREFGTPEDELYFGNNEGKVMILSGDKDFPQLQRASNVDQFSPVTKKFLRTNTPDKFLMEHIIRGDVGDGVPNFLSSDNCLVVKTRQKPIMQAKLDEWLKCSSAEEVCGGDAEMLRNWKRNEVMIDLRHTPGGIYSETMSQYNAQEGKKKNRLASYFIKYRLRNLHSALGDF